MKGQIWLSIAFTLTLISYLAYAVWQRTLGPIDENVLAPLIPLMLVLYMTAKDIIGIFVFGKRKLI